MGAAGKLLDTLLAQIGLSREQVFITNREVRVGLNADRYRLALVEVSPDSPSSDRVRYLDVPFAGINIALDLATRKRCRARSLTRIRRVVILLGTDRAELRSTCNWFAISADCDIPRRHL